MTGLVMEIREKTVLVMTDTGAFEEWALKNNTLQIGQAIEKPKEQASIINLSTFMKGGQRRIASVAAMILLVISLTGVGSYAYFTPVGYINVDINPSVELTYNRFERVLSIRALNPDGEVLAATSKRIKNEKLSKAITEVIDISKDEGFIKDSEDNFVLITNTSLDGQTNDVQAEIMAVNDVKTDQLYFQTLESDVETYTKASVEGVSPGKKILVEKAKALLEENESQEVILDEKTNLGQLLKTIRMEENKKVQKNAKDKDSTSDDQGESTPSETFNNGNGKGPDKEKGPEINMKDQEKGSKEKDKDKIKDKEDKKEDKISNDKKEENKEKNQNNGQNKRQNDRNSEDLDAQDDEDHEEDKDKEDEEDQDRENESIGNQKNSKENSNKDKSNKDKENKKIDDDDNDDNEGNDENEEVKSKDEEDQDKIDKDNGKDKDKNIDKENQGKGKQSKQEDINKENESQDDDESSEDDLTDENSIDDDRDSNDEDDIESLSHDEDNEDKDSQDNDGKNHKVKEKDKENEKEEKNKNDKSNEKGSPSGGKSKQNKNK